MKLYKHNGVKVPWFHNTVPFKVQLEALTRSRGQEGWGHFLEQGLGKTQITLNEFFALSEFGSPVTKLLVVAPNTFKQEWRNEAKKAAVAIPIYVHEANAKLLAQFLRNNRDAWIVVLNPQALLTTGFDAVKDSLCGDDVMFAWDESIKLKNNRGSTTQIALRHADRCAITRALSGKITTQGPHDLWGQLRFIKRVKTVNYYQFRNRYCIMGGFSGHQVVAARNEEELSRNLADCCFIARKKDWSDLPDKLYAPPRHVDMLPDQAKIYEQMLKDYFYEIDNSPLSVAQTVTRDGKLHQIKSGFIIDEFGNARDLVPRDKNPRVKFVREYLEDEVNGKLIVVAIFKHSCSWLLEQLHDFYPAYIKGGMKPDEIDAQKKFFNETEPCRIIILQQQASKYGHTLLGTEKSPCSTMLFYEQSYSLDDRSQVEDRMHRYGQKHTCVYQDISMSPLDHAQLLSLQRKEDMAATIMQYAREHGLLPNKLPRANTRRAGAEVST